MDRPSLPPQRRFHPDTILSLLRGAPERGPADCADIGYSPGGGRERMAGCQRSREVMPDIEQADLPGTRSREHIATGEKRERRSSCGGFSRLILSWNIRG